MLAGQGTMVQHVLPVTNREQSPVRFQMEPSEQLRALDWIDTNGLELLGIFHSHPAGPDRPSATDIAEAAYAVVTVILSRREAVWDARGFWIEDGLVSEVQLDFADGE